MHSYSDVYPTLLPIRTVGTCVSGVVGVIGDCGSIDFSSNVGRGEPSVITPPGTYGPKAQKGIPPDVGRTEAEVPVVR